MRLPPCAIVSALLPGENSSPWPPPEPVLSKGTAVQSDGYSNWKPSDGAAYVAGWNDRPAAVACGAAGACSVAAGCGVAAGCAGTAPVGWLRIVGITGAVAATDEQAAPSSVIAARPSKD